MDQLFSKRDSISPQCSGRICLELAEVRAIVSFCSTACHCATPSSNSELALGLSALRLLLAHEEINIHITYLLNVRVQSEFRC